MRYLDQWLALPIKLMDPNINAHDMVAWVEVGLHGSVMTMSASRLIKLYQGHFCSNSGPKNKTIVIFGLMASTLITLDVTQPKYTW